MTTPDVRELAWPSTGLGEALERLARDKGLATEPEEMPSPPPDDSVDALTPWIQSVAVGLGLEAEPVECSYAEVESMIARAGPAILRLPGEGGARFVALCGRGRKHVRVLAPDLRVHKVSIRWLRHTLCAQAERRHGAPIDRLLAQTKVAAKRRARVRDAILKEHLGPGEITGCWLLRLPPSASFRRQMSQERHLRTLVAFVGAHIAQFLVMLGAWWIVGRGALQGRLDPGWLWAWALVLLTMVALQLLMTWWRGEFAIGVGQLFKQRLLHGALQLRPREIRHQGVGQLLARVIESSALGSMALSAALAGVMAVVELAFAGGVLALGAGGSMHVLLLLAWATLTAVAGWRYYRRRLAWTEQRLELTHDLVEGMVGHRTRLAQEPRDQWHRAEDAALERYLSLAGRLDQTAIQLSVWLGRGWILVGLLGLMPAFVSGQATTTSLAIALGGVLLASQALHTLTGSLTYLSAAGIAWKQAAPMFHAAARSRDPGIPARALDKEPGDEPVVQAHDLVFRYPGRLDPILRNCALEIRRGDRILLQGPSGGGKSTLVSVLTGLRDHQSGLLLLRGLDRQSLGPQGWRRMVAAAPQFQENHVFTGTLAYNLLMARRWPAAAEDVAEAEQVCRELGLGELLDRMPGGMNQVIGETGWRLSHGEQSRLFMARALLQGADLVVLDESFAALDPASLRQALSCALKRAPSLLVVAHP